jgi:iron complex transport system ATP-binding protein
VKAPVGPLVEAQEVGFGYRQLGRPVLRDLSFTAGAGELIGVCGPNGAGKSTLLRLVLGLCAPASGRVRLCGDDVGLLSRRQIARRAALLPQESPPELPFSVRDVVALGRLPHLGRFQSEGPADVDTIERAMMLTDTAALAERPVAELSGGERQRVHLARAIAQGAPVLLLDEPTASLDLSHQLQALQLLRAISRQGRCVLVALHDLSLAARSCDRILLLAGGELRADAPPREVLTAANLARFFHVRAVVRSDEEGGPFVIPIASLPPGGEPGSAD